MKMAHNTPESHSLESRSTEELEAMLRSDLDGEQELSPETLDQVLTILRSRNAICVPSPRETEAAWERFQDRCKVSPEDGCFLRSAETEQPQHTKSPQATKRMRPWLRGCIAAVMVCVLILFVPPALSAENLYDVIVRWTQDVLSFEPPTVPAPPPTEKYAFSSDNPGLHQVYDAVSQLGVTYPVVPTWLPEGYALSELKTHTLEDRNRVIGIFTCENETILVSIIKTAPGGTAPALFDKDIENPEMITKGGIAYYIFRDITRWKCVWGVGDLTCMITTGGEKEELMRILDSIYQGGTS